MRGLTLAPALALAALAMAGCGILTGEPLLGDAKDPYTIHVVNGTDLAIEIVVNGRPVSRVEPHVDQDVLGDIAGPRPWTVAAETATSGRQLLSFPVADGDVDIEGSNQSGVGAREDLSCGRLDVYVGPPMLGPAPGPGVPGDCLP